MQPRDCLRSEPLFSELPRATPVIIWASPSWSWSYFTFISRGVVFSAVDDPLSGQDIRLGHQKFGPCLTSLRWKRFRQGRDSWPPLCVLICCCPQDVAFYCHSWPLFVPCPPPGTPFPLLHCPFRLCIMPGAPHHPTIHPPWSPFPHSTFSTVSPQTVYANLFVGIRFCLLVLSSWVASLQLRQQTAGALPSLTLPSLPQSLPWAGPLIKPASIELTVAALLEDSQLDGWQFTHAGDFSVCANNFLWII